MSQIARHDFKASGPPTTTSYYEATEDLGTPFEVFLALGLVSGTEGGPIIACLLRREVSIARATVSQQHENRDANFAFEG